MFSSVTISLFKETPTNSYIRECENTCLKEGWLRPGTGRGALLSTCFFPDSKAWLLELLVIGNRRMFSFISTFALSGHLHHSVSSGRLILILLPKTQKPESLTPPTPEVLDVERERLGHPFRVTTD